MPSKKYFRVFNRVQLDSTLNMWTELVCIVCVCVCETKMLIAVEITRKFTKYKTSNRDRGFLLFFPKKNDNRFIHFFLLKAACACAITRCAWYVTAKRTNVTMSQLFFSCNENENEGWFIFIYLLIETMTKTVGMFFLISHRENTTICFQFQMNKLQKDYIKVWIYFLKIEKQTFFFCLRWKRFFVFENEQDQQHYYIKLFCFLHVLKK